MEYFVLLAIWISGAPLTLGFKYVGVNVISTSLRDSISSQSPLCRRDCLVDVLPKTLTIFGGEVTTIAIPPRLNL